jgi:TolA-binding protein
MNMVNVNVPVATVVATMQGSGRTYTPADVRCLESKGAPTEVVAAAERLGGATPDVAPVAPVTPAAETKKGQPDPVADALLGDFGTEEMDDGGGPAIIEELIANYRAQKYLTASKGLYDIFRDDTYPEHRTKVAYYLAKSLYDMGMYHGAQRYFLEVVRGGPSNPYFKYALPRLVAIAKHTGNDAELLRFVDKVPPESFPRQAKNYLYYLKGRKLYDDDELSEASSYFQQISPKSDVYLQARYFDGVINQRRGKLKSAVLAFRDVMQTEPQAANAQQASQAEAVKDLALINVARIYYGLERFENSDNYYAMVPRDSIYWPESLFERAWSNFMMQDLNQTLGLLLTVQSPYFDDEEYLPEVVILRALTYFQLCEYNEVQFVLDGFKARYNPTLNEMERVLDKYRGDGRKIADQAYRDYFGAGASTQFPQALFARILRNSDLASLVRHMDMLDEELLQIDDQKAAWKDTVGEGLRSYIATDRQRYEKRAGLLFLRELAYQHETLKNKLFEAETVEFEVVDAQRLDYEFRMGNPDVNAMNEDPIDFATDPYTIYWPFNGEFWRDELGYYEYSEPGNCQ